MGEEVCKIKGGKLSEEELSAKKRGKQPIGVNNTKKVVDKDGQEDGGELSRGQGSVKRSKK